MVTTDLPRGKLYTCDKLLYEGYIEWKNDRVEVYEDSGVVYRIPSSNISHIEWDIPWKIKGGEKSGKT